MNAQTICAEVAHRTGEQISLIRRRGFQPLTKSKPRHAGKLSAVDCPFCGQQVLVARVGSKEAECRGCDTSFETSPSDVYSIALRDAERPKGRAFRHEGW